MTMTMTLKKITLATVVGLCAAGTFASGAAAMTLHNCTNDPLKVVLMDKNGDYNQPAWIYGKRTKQIHATNSFGPYRIVLPDLGQGAHFSGRSGDGTFSLIRTGGGNIGIRNGNACKKPDADYRNPDRDGKRLCFRNDYGIEVCLRP